MFRFVIHNTEYACPETWGEVTIAHAIEIQRLTEALSESIKAWFRSLVDQTEHTNDELEETMLTKDEAEELRIYRMEMLRLLSGVPREVLERTEEEDIADTFNHCLGLFVISLLVMPLYEPQGMKSFEHNGETLMLPQSGRDIFDVITPLEKISAREFCEAADLSAADNLSLAPILIAVLCRPEGEPYDEERVKERARGMKYLTMDIYMEVFFCLLGLTAIWQKSTLDSIPPVKKTRAKGNGLIGAEGCYMSQATGPAN